MQVMNGEAVNTGKKGSGLAKFLYVVAAVLAVIFVYMLIVNIMYISSYAASYGMSFSDMWQEAVQYIVTGSVSYFVYAVLVFAAGKIVSIVQTGGCVPCAPQVGEETCCDENFEETEDADVEADDVKAEGFDPDQVINRLGKKEEAEEKSDDEAEPEMQPEDEPDEPDITVVPIRERRKRRFIK
ncbi:MAG: hypothetical protein IJ988_03915 [Firmicutes bacterium]|nr:hypothetical protein [Bacillota bacterium]